jgi:hypothetical protein
MIDDMLFVLRQNNNLCPSGAKAGQASPSAAEITPAAKTRGIEALPVAAALPQIVSQVISRIAARCFM